ncbi:MAG: hypothetical protein JRG89_13585 [Deltaproteobacteria bacterium]|nr:hypothetical protein [Deltaproteobacteria bacterium]MBW2389453.1 hypothetical protein [Deltaproteobacteria bacterium]MBW2725375.1 hypothetical protein [Deltaproteobacteria bacterium]
MFFDRLLADFGAQARAFAVLVIGGVLMTLLTACSNGDASGSGCVIFDRGIAIDFNDDATGGFDDFRSVGAALGVAIDEGDPRMGLVIALRFSSATTEEFYSPTCDTSAAIDSYDFAELNNVTAPIAVAYPFITAGLTDTTGIEMMDHTMNALLFIDDEDGLRFFLAVHGNIALRRDLAAASTARVTGDLTFVELTVASAVAEVLAGGQVLHIADIDMSWDTFVQPTD